jgi:EAL domain-containing protein (putative c-di-GMP-specific phosphodiesterase class I)
LAYVRRFPIDVLKIDREFVSELATDRAIVEAVLAMGRHMEVAVVAEGVETVEQDAALRALGCVLAQGFLYARPMPADDLSPRLGERLGAVGELAV